MRACSSSRKLTYRKVCSSSLLLRAPASHALCTVFPQNGLATSGLTSIVNRHGSLTALDDWLAWLDTLSPREIELGLDRVQNVLSRMELPRPRHVIHVAGTNGKGSTAAMLEAMFIEADTRVGCYTSPHVRRFNERMRVQGQELDDETIVAAFRVVEAARQKVILTYFEFGTLAALAAFAKAGTDVLVLEIGLGGRLDAVNAIDPDAAIITNVTLDHCDWLGDDIESIAVEKAGVMRRGIPVVYGSGQVPAAIIDEAARHGADLRLTGRDFRYVDNEDSWDWRGRTQSLNALQKPALAGSFQLQNAAAVLAVIEALGLEAMLDAPSVNAAMQRLSLPGRLQRIEGRRRWLLDVAHNPDAARVLGAALPAINASGRLVAVFGVLADKDVDGIVAPLCNVVDTWIAVPADSPRALAPESLAARVANLCDKPCRIADSIAAGLTLAASLTSADDQILVTGSFYTVGPALECLDKMEPDAV